MTTSLKIARNLALPLSIVGEVTTIIAKRGAGKTNAAKVVAEEVLDSALVQVVVLDPIGVWWALRAGADGKPRGGYDIAVFGGMHGDLPLEETAGKLLAETVVDSGQSVILDVSDLDSDGAMQRFVLDFAERLYRLKQSKPTPLLLILEESDEFAPQDTRGANVARMVGAINRIAKRGRGRGIGLVPVTQRSAALNKNVLDQSDTLVILRTTGPRDRDAIKGWIEHQRAEGFDQIASSLPNLKTGEAWVWTPERELLERVQIRKSRTFDSGRTPEPGEAVLEAEVKPIDLDALGEKMRATVERVKENDPALLRRRVTDLQRELAQRPVETVEPERVEVSVITDEDWTRLNALFGSLPPEAKRLADFAAQIEIGLSDFASKLLSVKSATRREQDVRTSAQPPAGGTGPRPAPATQAPVATRDLGTGARRLLETLGRHHPTRLPAGQLAVLSGRKARGGAWNTAMRELRSGYVIESGGLLELTEEGLKASGAEFMAPLDTEQVIDQWRNALPTGARALFDLLVSIYPNYISPLDAAERLGKQARGGAWNTAVSTLVRSGLAEKGPGVLRASDTLYAEGAT